MKYMLLINTAPADSAAEAEAQAVCGFEDWVAYDKQAQDAGIVVASHALADLTTATKVRVTADGERVITTDGPFAEAREVLGGYYVIDVPDLDVALDWAARCPGARDGSVVVRPITDEY